MTDNPQLFKIGVGEGAGGVGEGGKGRGDSGREGMTP